jgi:hypothetical protein
MVAIKTVPGLSGTVVEVLPLAAVEELVQPAGF